MSTDKSSTFILLVNVNSNVEKTNDDDIEGDDDDDGFSGGGK